MRSRTGFTLIELLIVMGIVGILAAVVLVAINPTKQLCDAQNAKRKAHVNSLTKAIQQYIIGEWEMPGGSDVPTGEANAEQICAAGITNDTTCVNLDVLVPEYIAALPVDVAETNANHTGFGVYKTDANRQFAVALRYDDNCAAASTSSNSSTSSASASSASASTSSTSSDTSASSDTSVTSASSDTSVTSASSSSSSCMSLELCHQAMYNMCQAECASYGYNSFDDCAVMLPIPCSNDGGPNPECYMPPSSCPIEMNSSSSDASSSDASSEDSSSSE